MAVDKKQLIEGKWIHQPQEQDGDYWFDGRIFMTNNIQADIPQIELMGIINHLQTLAKEQEGIDYLQVFKTEEGDKIFIIDQITKSQIETSPKEYHYCTILYPYEY